MRVKDWELRVKLVEFIDYRGALSKNELLEVYNSPRIIRELVHAGLIKYVMCSTRTGDVNHNSAVRSSDLFGRYARTTVYYVSPLKLQLFLFNNLYEITNDNPDSRLIARLTRFIKELGYPLLIDSRHAPQKQKIKQQWVSKKEVTML